MNRAEVVAGREFTPRLQFLRITKSEQTGKKMIGKTKTLEAFTTEIESIVRKQKER